MPAGFQKTPDVMDLAFEGPIQTRVLPEEQ